MGTKIAKLIDEQRAKAVAILMGKIDKKVEDEFGSWRKYEQQIKGKVTNAMKKQIAFNLDKMNAMLEVLGLELSLRKLKK